MEIPGDQGYSVKLWTIIADLQLEYCNPKCPRVGNLVELQYWDQINHPCDSEFIPFRLQQGQRTTVTAEVIRNVTLN